jgi:hypothetical protein
MRFAVLPAAGAADSEIGEDIGRWFSRRVSLDARGAVGRTVARGGALRGAALGAVAADDATGRARSAAACPWRYFSRT